MGGKSIADLPTIRRNLHIPPWGIFHKFKNKNTIKLYIQKISITEATVKEEIIDIPGADGCLDFSESLTGDVKFNNRVIREIL